MGTRAYKLLGRMRASKTGWKRNDLDRLYEGFGLIIKHGGGHDKVYHPDYPQIFAFLPRHTKLARGYVEEAVKNIDKLISLKERKDEKK